MTAFIVAAPAFGPNTLIECVRPNTSHGAERSPNAGPKTEQTCAFKVFGQSERNRTRRGGVRLSRTPTPHLAGRPFPRLRDVSRTADRFVRHAGDWFWLPRSHA